MSSNEEKPGRGAAKPGKRERLELKAGQAPRNAREEAWVAARRVDRYRPEATRQNIRRSRPPQHQPEHSPIGSRENERSMREPSRSPVRGRREPPTLRSRSRYSDQRQRSRLTEMSVMKRGIEGDLQRGTNRTEDGHHRITISTTETFEVRVVDMRGHVQLREAVTGAVLLLIATGHSHHRAMTGIIVTFEMIEADASGLVRPEEAAASIGLLLIATGRDRSQSPSRHPELNCLNPMEIVPTVTQHSTAANLVSKGAVATTEQTFQ